MPGELALEICKKLKDAGWSQVLRRGDLYHYDSWSIDVRVWFDDKKYSHEDPNYIRIPTTDELLTKCVERAKEKYGEDYYNISLTATNDDTFETTVIFNGGTSGCPEIESFTVFDAPSPASAFAELWLKLIKE